MKCPVCKTECDNKTICPECNFSELTPEFINEREGINWEFNVLWPWRRKYWATLPDFQIKGNVLCKYLGNHPIVKIPHGITSIGMSCFSHNSYVREIILPVTIDRIECFAFVDCTALSKINFPPSLRWIDHHSFAHTDALNEIIIPENVRNIGTAAFLARCNPKPKRTVNVFCEAHDEVVSRWSEYWDSDIVLYSKGTWHYDENGKPVVNKPVFE